MMWSPPQASVPFPPCTYRKSWLPILIAEGLNDTTPNAATVWRDEVSWYEIPKTETGMPASSMQKIESGPCIRRICAPCVGEGLAHCGDRGLVLGHRDAELGGRGPDLRGLGGEGREERIQVTQGDRLGVVDRAVDPVALDVQVLDELEDVGRRA